MNTPTDAPVERTSPTETKGDSLSCEGWCCQNEEGTPVEKGAWIIAGAVLLAGLMVTAALLVAPKSGKTGGDTTETPTEQAAKPNQPTTVTLDQVRSLFTDKNITFGDKKSKVLFVEFSDPSCPYCHIAGGENPELNKQAGSQFMLVKDGGSYIPPVPEMRKLVESGKAAFTWFYANGHGNGELATKALYCASEKGKFWEAHDLIMSSKGFNLLNNDVKNDVSKAGVLADFLKSAVNPADMKACITSGKYDNRITGDMAVARQMGFQGTPAFFINETSIPGAVNYKDMQSLVDNYLKK